MTIEEETEHRVGMVALASQIKTLVESNAEIKAILREIQTQVADVERRSVSSCKSCDLRATVITMSKDLGMLEKEVAGMNGRAAGMSLAAAGLAFLANFFMRK